MAIGNVNFAPARTKFTLMVDGVTEMWFAVKAATIAVGTVSWVDPPRISTLVNVTASVELVVAPRVGIEALAGAATRLSASAKVAASTAAPTPSRRRTLAEPEVFRDADFVTSSEC